jgi:hypothetical protein
MMHHSWKHIVTLDEAWFYLSVFLLITNQVGSVQKMKLQKKRTIPEDNADGRLEPRRFHWIDVLPKQRAANLALGMISRTSYRPYPKFLLLIKLTQGDVL